jgi:Zn-finger nucleic acid-binding protein
MKCPKCDVALMMTERQNVEVDYCPNCRGVWLDRGELDKIMERAAAVEAQQPASAPGQPVPQQPYPPQAHPHDPRYHRDQYHGKPYYKKRKSFLSEIFDFD